MQRRCTRRSQRTRVSRLTEPEGTPGAVPENREFTSPLAAVAIQLNETFEELKSAGFTQQEALHIVSHLLSSMMNYNTNDYLFDEDDSDEEEDTDDGEGYF